MSQHVNDCVMLCLINSREVLEFIIVEIAAFFVWTKYTVILYGYIIENTKSKIFASDTSN